ncbi:EamA family transporter [Candidatus Pelagibacter sp.]|nr:EamA family transporter [Candidatus Pelagibacter sp.]
MEFFNSKLVLVCAVIGFQSVAQIFLKIGVHKESINFLLPINIWTMFGYLCILINFIFWMQYLRLEKLNVATAAISLIYIIIPLLSALILKESLSLKMIMGFALITGGVVLTQVENV